MSGGRGPLAGVRVVEMAGKGPVPFCAMMLADHGAEIVRVDRPQAERRFPARDPRLDVMNRGRRSIALDLKRPQACEAVLRLVEQADILLEGFRPGVMERLGLGPDVCLGRNPRLVYGRATGWGQTGPLARTAGHDINYLALSGLLAAMRRSSADKPMPPLNILGDYAAGGLMLAFGVIAALLESRSGGQGQVVDAAMLDGLSVFGSLYHGLMNMGQWGDEPGDKVYDTSAPYYDTYRTSDGRYVSVGAIEAGFYRELLERLGVDSRHLDAQHDLADWPRTKKVLEQVFATRTQKEWCEAFEGTDVCFAPVLTMREAREHPHARDRGVFTSDHGHCQPAPAPRFSRTSSKLGRPPPVPGEHGRQILAECGYSETEVDGLFDAGIVRMGSQGDE